jgi:hypothetical protein
MKKSLLPLLMFLFVACKNKKNAGSIENKPSGNTTEVVKTNEEPPLFENETSLIGKWVVIDADFSEKMTKEERDAIVGKATVEFFADGKFTTISPEDNDTDKGTYSFDAKANKLTIISQEGDIKAFSIIWIDGHLKMTSEEGSMILKRSGK